METISLNKEKIITLYNEGNDKTKEMLIMEFGKEIFSSTKAWIELWDKFCKDNKIKVILPHANPETPEEKWDNSCVMLRYIIKIRRGNWVPDLNDKDQKRWFPVFEMTPTGLVFSYTLFECWLSLSFATIGAPLCYPTSKLVKDTVNEFLPIYEVLINPK